jgi:hypothetical protein
MTTTTTTKRDDGMILLSHTSTGTTAKASSILQNNSKVYGPAHALDCTNTLTSWNSEGNPKGKTESFLVVDFSGGGKNQNRKVNPVELVVQFQAGFAAEEITVYRKNNTKAEDDNDSGDNNSRWLKVDEMEAEDDHESQSFPLSVEEPTTALKIVFDETTDFYGRVIIYQIQIWGKELGDQVSKKEERMKENEATKLIERRSEI